MSKLPEPGDARAFYVLDLHAFVWRNVTGARQRAPDTFARWLGRLMQAQKIEPDQIVAADDSKGETFRHAILREAGKLGGAGYKGDRKQVDPGLYAIYERSRASIAEMLGDVGIAIFRAPKFEADDVIATITELAVQGRWSAFGEDRAITPRAVVIVGGDRDLLALVGPRGLVGSVTVYDGYRRIYATVEDVKRYMGVPPSQIADFWALVGGKNNVPGVRGIGPAAAKEILERRSLAETLRLLAVADAQGLPEGEFGAEHAMLGMHVPAIAKILARLRAGADDARLSRRLTELRADASIVRDPG